MVISDYITPVMYVDPSGESWIHWGIAVGVVALLAVLTVVTCGGFAAGLSAIILAGNGIAAVGLSPVATVLAFTTAGASLALGGSAIYAGLSSSSLDEFAEYGSFALLSTTVGGVIGAYLGYVSTKQDYYRAMSNAEVQAVQDTGYLRGGRGGQTFFTNTPYYSSNTAQSQLSLPTSPDYMMRFRIVNNPFIYGPQVVDPFNGMNGGGIEYYTYNQVRVIVKSIWRLH